MSKQNLILIHGLRGNHLGLAELADYLKPYFNVFVPDIPPAGNKSLKEYSKDTYADFIADYIKTNKISHPILVGHSMGSIIAAAVAEKYSDLIDDRIVFLSPISTKPAKFFAMLTPLTAVLPNKLIGYITTKYMYIPHDKKLLKKVLAITYQCGSDYTTKNDVYQSAKFSAACSIADLKFKQKALFLSGEKDRLIPLKKTEALAKKLDAKSDIVPNTGHLLNYEDPKTTADKIIAFLKTPA